jgi:hypothetical protein
MRSAAVVRSQIAKRRSNRMSLEAAVGLSGQDRQKSSFTMSVRASNLNRHGAAIETTRELAVGSTVVVRNKRGIEVSARIIRLVSAVEGLHTYGIEFLDHSDGAKGFWGISFPTA